MSDKKHFSSTTNWIARRMRPATGSAGLGTVIAMAGVAVAVVVMELTLGIVVGFKDEIRRKLAGFEAQVVVGAPYDIYTRTQDTYIEPDTTLSALLDTIVQGANISMAMRLPAILKTDSTFEGIVMMGRSAESEFAFERANIVEGRWPDYTSDSCRNDIVISRATATALGLGVGSDVYATYIVDGQIKLRRSHIAGIYSADFGEYDRTIAYASLSSLQGVAGVNDSTGTRIEIRGLDENNIDATAEALETAQMKMLASHTADRIYPVDTVHHSGAVYYSWLSLLDTNVAVIFALMMTVAAFTIVSSLFVLVLDRISTIGILRTLGARRATIRSIFVDMGMYIVATGMALGNIVGIGLLLFQKYTNIIPLDPNAYYLSSVPVHIVWWQFIVLNAGIALTAWLVLWIPARTAARIDPARTIKFE